MIIRKKELVDIISEKTGLKKYEVKEVIESLGETIYEELKKDNIITIKKLFRIEPVIREERQRYNPATEEYDTVDINIFRSVENVNLDTIISYRKGDEFHHFLDDYNK